MLWRFLSKVIRGLAWLWALSALLFWAITRMPGDPIELSVQGETPLDVGDLRRLREVRGLDDPWTQRYLRWLWGYHDAQVPPAISPLPPVITVAGPDGSAEVVVDPAPALPPRPGIVTGLYGVRVEQGRLVARFERPGVHAIWFRFRDRAGLEALGHVRVFVAPGRAGERAPAADGDHPGAALEEERQLAGSTEPDDDAPLTESDQLAAALEANQTWVVDPIPVQWAPAGGEIAVDLHQALRGPYALGELGFALPEGEPGTITGGVYRHRFAAPGQSVVRFWVRGEGGRRGAGAVAIEHGALPDPAQFHRGFLFALLGDAAGLGFSRIYQRPVWELLIGRPPPCGDGRRVPGEMCDDGNRDGGDGCSPTCEREGAPARERLANTVLRAWWHGGRILHTALLVGPALALSLCLAIPLGLLAALRPRSALDRAISFLSYGGVSVPVYWLGILGLSLFAERLGWLPAGGMATPGLEGPLSTQLADGLRHAALPGAILTFVYAARWIRFVRTSALEVLPQAWVRAARSRGLGPVTFWWRYVLRNALAPLISAIALALPSVVGGALLVEVVFAWPGVGRLQYEAILQHDHALALSLFLVTSTALWGAHALADVAYAWLDPRVRARASGDPS